MIQSNRSMSLNHHLHLDILVYAVIAGILIACSGKDKNSLSENTLLDRLDATIAHTPHFDSLKVADIIHSTTLPARTPMELFERNRQLFLCYESFVCDSAMHYLNANIALARTLSRNDLLTEVLIDKADLMAKAGLFNESFTLLRSISAKDLPVEQRTRYYLTYEIAYQYLYEYTEGSNYATEYMQHVAVYQDSVLKVAIPNTYIYETEYGSRLLKQGQTAQAIACFRRELDRHTSGTREYSVLTSLLAYAYQTQHNHTEQKRYITLSAISDIQGSIKENLAMRTLAELCFESNEVERAYTYLMKSMEDANYFSARMRKNQSARLLPLVTQTYGVMQEEYRHRLTIYLLIISLLAGGLIIALSHIFKQLKIVSGSLQLVSQTKDQLQALNEQLSASNQALQASNNALTESSRIKEEYIGKFMELCSLHISTLEQYRKSLTRQATQGKVEELYKLLRSEQIIQTTLKDFYTAFDSSFLNLFPHFVEQFNALFPTEERIVLRKEEQLNTELRTFALIRLGITGSDKIASFLRCSITTIYTYRSKRKKHSLCPDTFDEEILKIGV